MKWLRLLGLAILLGTLGVAPGCNRDSGKIKVAFVTNNIHDFWKIADKGTQKAAKDFDVEVEFRKPAKGNVKDQRDIIEDLLTKGVKGIAVSPNDAKGSQNFFKTEVSSKIPLIAQDNDLPDPSIRQCFIGTNNYQAGWDAGKLVKKALPKGGTMAIFVGRMDATNAVQRRQGVLDFLVGRKNNEDLKHVDDANATDLKVGDYTLLTTRTDLGSEPKCQEQAEDVMTKYPNVDCLVGLWEYNPPAMLRAIEDLPKKPKVVAFDENYKTLKGIQDGKVVGTIVQDPYHFGYMSVQVMAGLARGKKLEKLIDDLKKKFNTEDEKIITVEPNNTIYVRHRTIDQSNVDAFYKEVKQLKGD